MNLEGKRIVVVGGSRSLGLGLAEAFAERAAAVTVVARNTISREHISEKLGLNTISADATSADAAKRIMEDVRPDIAVVNVGAEPPMERIDRIDWETFTANWNVDVKASLHWVQAALTMPMERGGGGWTNCCRTGRHLQWRLLSGSRRRARYGRNEGAKRKSFPFR